MENHTVVAYASLAELKEAHSRLLKRYREYPVSKIVSEVEYFLERGVVTGALLDVPDDRRSAQGLLDYWVTVLYRTDHNPPDVALSEFDPTLSPNLEDSVCPYIGLSPFHEANKDNFFGRRTLIQNIVGALKHKRFLCVVGPSGSGKSSIVLAGVIPALKNGALSGSKDWKYFPTFVPGSEPLRNLLIAIKPPNHDTATWLDKHLPGMRAENNYLLRLVDTDRPSTIVIDQFEELFSLCTDVTARDIFAQNIANFVESSSPRGTVLATLRTDFETQRERLQSLRNHFEKGIIHVPPLTAAELKEVIEQPAQKVGLRFESGIVHQLVDELLGEPAGLPLLQFSLRQLWARRDRNRITWAAYESIGGARRALALSANEFFNSLIPQDQQTAKRILLRLTRPTEGLEVMSNRVMRDTLYKTGEAFDQVDRVLDKLIDAGLIRLTRGETPRSDQLEVAHEALIRNWNMLVEWLDQERTVLRRRLRLTADAEQWSARGEDPSNLLRGNLLEEASQYPDLNALEEKYINESRRAEMEAKSAAEDIIRKRKRLRLTQAVAIVLGLTTAILLLIILKHKYETQWPYVRHYNSFVKQWGAPVGIGLLTDEQVSHRPISFKITQQGSKGLVQRVEAISSGGQVTALNFDNSYLPNDAENESSTPVAWDFTYDAKGDVQYESALDVDNNIVWRFVYAPSTMPHERVRRGSYVGRDGYPLPQKKYFYSLVEIAYNEEGMEEYIRYKTRGGAPVRGRDKAYGQHRRYNQNKVLVELTSLDRDGTPMNDEVGNATMLTRVADDLGNQIEQVALDRQGNVAVMNEGWSIVRTKTDRYGNPIEEAYYNQSDEPTMTNNGYHKIQWELDSRGNELKKSFWDLSGRPSINRISGCHALEKEFDSHNLTIRQTCMWAGHIIGPDIDGVTTYLFSYNTRGQITENTALDAKGQLTSSVSGYARYVQRYDEAGRVIEIAFYDASGNPAQTHKGYSTLKYEYDGRGLLTTTTYYGRDGNPVLHSDGYARLQKRFDTYGNPIEEKYFGSDGKRASIYDGTSGSISTYDSNGNRIEMTYINSNGERTLSADGTTGFRSMYDSFGSEVSHTNLGVRNEPTFSGDGIVSWEATYDSLGREITRAYYGDDGKRVTHKDGYSMRVLQYDALGNTLEEKYFDIYGAPALRKWDTELDGESESDDGAAQSRRKTSFRYSRKDSGYWRKSSKYNNSSQITELAYLGIYNEPVESPEGWARVIHSYDSRGNRIETAYFGSLGEPVRKHGYHRVRWAYDEQGLDIEVRYFSEEGHPVMSTAGYSRIARKHNRFGRITEESFFDRDGKPVISKDGYHQLNHTYDDRGREVENKYFGVNGQPTTSNDGYHAVMFKYSDRGDLLEKAFFDVRGKLTRSKSVGASIAQYSYDERGKHTELLFLDERSRLIENRHGFAKLKIRYNEKGQEVEKIWFDAHDAPSNGNAAYAGLRTEYNARGQVVATTYNDVTGRPVLLPGLFATIRNNYDVHGNLIEERYYGTVGNPVNNSYGYHSQKTKYNNRRQITDFATYDINGNLALNSSGYARITNKYDDRGNLIELTLFDSTGKPADIMYGVARVSRRYDTRGNIIEESYYGADGHPKIRGDFGCAKVMLKYDSEGNAIEEKCFGDSDESLILLHGYVKAKRKFGSYHRLLEETYFDSDNRPKRLLGTGQHLTRFGYDAHGNKISEDYFDEHMGRTYGWSLEEGTICKRWTAKYDFNGKPSKMECET
jgi:YD repeat-containing protein